MKYLVDYDKSRLNMFDDFTLHEIIGVKDKGRPPFTSLQDLVLKKQLKSCIKHTNCQYIAAFHKQHFLCAYTDIRLLKSREKLNVSQNHYYETNIDCLKPLVCFIYANGAYFIGEKKIYTYPLVEETNTKTIEAYFRVVVNNRGIL